MDLEGSLPFSEGSTTGPSTKHCGGKNLSGKTLGIANTYVMYRNGVLTPSYLTIPNT